MPISKHRRKGKLRPRSNNTRGFIAKWNAAMSRVKRILGATPKGKPDSVDPKWLHAHARGGIGTPMQVQERLNANARRGV